MTEYSRTTVRSPEAAFDRLREEFYVEKDNEEGLTLIHKSGSSPIDDPVRNLIAEEFGLEEFSAGGKGIRYQRGLPEELRDEESFENEQARATPAGESISREEAESIVRVLAEIRERESDHDHVYILDSAIERVNELQVGSPVKESDADPVVEDVEATLAILEREGVEYGLTDGHPNRVLMGALEFVERDSAHGPLPDPRE